MKKFKSLLAIAALISGSAFAAGIDQKIRTDKTILGIASSTDDKVQEFDTGDGGSNVTLTVQDDRDVILSTSGTTTITSPTVTIGNAAAADQTMIFDDGNAGSNARIFVENSTGQLKFQEVGGSAQRFASGTGDQEPNTIENASVATSVASSALTVALKQLDGSTDATALSPARFGMRKTPVTDGSYNLREVTGALSIVIPSGATLGHIDATDEFIYIYVLDNAGTVELAVSSSMLDESVLQTSLTIGTGSDDAGLYSTTGRASVPIRLIARLKSNQTTAGTWDANVLEIAPGPPPVEKFYISVSMGGDNAATGTSVLATYTGLTAAALDLVINRGHKFNPLQACPTTEVSSGLTCTGSESVGISFDTPDDEMDVTVCVNVIYQSNVMGGELIFQLIRTPNNAQTITEEGKWKAQLRIEGGNSIAMTPRLCGDFFDLPKGKNTIRVMREQTTTISGLVLMDRGAGVGQRDMHWTVQEI